MCVTCNMIHFYRSPATIEKVKRRGRIMLPEPHGRPVNWPHAIYLAKENISLRVKIAVALVGKQVRTKLGVGLGFAVCASPATAYTL